MSLIAWFGIAATAIVLLSLLAFAGIGFLIAWVIVNFHDEGEVYD